MALAPLMTPIIGVSAPLTEYRYHGRNLMNAPQMTSKYLDRGRQIFPMLWKVSREYLGKVDPFLVETFPSFDECQGILFNAYVRARLQTSGGVLSAYRDLLQAENFLALRLATRWFWRLSVLLPRPVFRYALGHNRIRRLFSWAVEARRRNFAS